MDAEALEKQNLKDNYELKSALLKVLNHNDGYTKL